MKGEILQVTLPGLIEQEKIIRKSIYRIITIIQDRPTGGCKLAQDSEKRTYIFEKGKWKDVYGNVWEIVEKIK